MDDECYRSHEEGYILVATTKDIGIFKYTNTWRKQTKISALFSMQL
jgi:hypothetical protein